MARIRSLHPGQWTDESFVSCSAYGRLLALGLRNEADDQGVFEWKPLTIKMRIFPADDVDVEALLSELVEHRQVQKFEFGGKFYGVIRNFRKYQRPKKPNATYPLPNELRTYAGLEDDNSEPVPNVCTEPVPNQSGNSSAEEGGRRKEVSLPNGKAPDGADDPEKKLFEDGKQLLGKSSGGMINKLLRAKGLDEAQSIIDEAKSKQDPREWVGAALREDDDLVAGMAAINRMRERIEANG